MNEGSDSKTIHLQRSANTIQTQNQIVSLTDTQENINCSISHTSQIQNLVEQDEQGHEEEECKANGQGRRLFDKKNHEDIFRIAYHDESEIPSFRQAEESFKESRKPQIVITSKRNISDSKEKSNTNKIKDSFMSIFRKKTLTNKHLNESEDEGFSSQLWQHRAMKIIQKVIYFSAQMLQLSATVRFRLLKKKQLLILNDVTAIDINKDLIDNSKNSKAKRFIITHIVMFLEEIFDPRQIVYSVIDIAKIIFIILFIAHMVSCFIYYISKSQSNCQLTWITRLNYTTWVEYYVTGLYFAIITMITIGYGDVVPVTINEKIFVMSMTLVSCGVFAYSLNTISRIISEFSLRRSKLRKKMIHLNMHIESRGLNKQIAVKVRKYLEYIYKESEQDWETSERDLQLIPQSLKDEVYQDIYGTLLRHSKIFSLNFSDNFISKIALLMKEKKYGPEEVIYRPDEQGSTLYFILKGVVELYLPVKNPSDNEYPVVSSLKKGDNFGIYSFFSGKCRETGAISKQVTSVVVLELKDFISTIQEYEEDYEIYSMMKDKINLNNSAFGLDVKCKSCGKYNHQLYDCPLITYRPKKQLVIARGNKSQPQKRSIFDRRNLRSPNSLYIWKYIRSFDSEILRCGRHKSLSSMTKLDEFVLEKKQSYSLKANFKLAENISEEDHYQEDDDENNSQLPFEDNLYPKQLSNQSNNGILMPQNMNQNPSIRKMISQGSNLVFHTQTPLSLAISNPPQNNNSLIFHNHVNHTTSQENILTQNSGNFGINQPNSPSKFKKNAEREEALRSFQNQKKSSGLLHTKQLNDDTSQQARDNNSNYSLKKKKKIQLISKSYQNTIHSYNSTLNVTHGFQAMNSNGSVHNPSNFANPCNLQNMYSNQQNNQNTQNNINNQNNQNNNNNNNQNVQCINQSNIQQINQGMQFINQGLQNINQNIQNICCQPYQNSFSGNQLQQQQTSLNQLNYGQQQPTFQEIDNQRSVDQVEDYKNDQIGSEQQVVYCNQISDQPTKNEFGFEPPFSIILDFDKAKTFKRYLPHNNLDKVLTRFKFLELKRNKSRMTSFIKKSSQTNIQKEKISLSQVVRQAERLRKQRRKLSLFISQQSQSDSHLGNPKRFKERHSVQSILPEHNLDLSKLRNFQQHLTNIETGDLKAFSKSEGQIKELPDEFKKDFDKTSPNKNSDYQ